MSTRCFVIERIELTEALRTTGAIREFTGQPVDTSRPVFGASG
ncbi:hypothetical protein I552_5517 [Mycobacterium xenopi 3993]|nr:hypothetical protein I552_5517 [Mycobacterium xenopi 3993]